VAATLTASKTKMPTRAATKKAKGLAPFVKTTAKYTTTKKSKCLGMADQLACTEEQTEQHKDDSTTHIQKETEYRRA
jgi:hypothetical protein